MKTIRAFLLALLLLSLAACSAKGEPESLVGELAASVAFDSETGALSFTVPEGLPGAYSFHIEASGRVRMGGGGMSAHLFEEEAANGWEAGKTYLHEFEPGSLLELTMLAGTVRKDEPEAVLFGTEVRVDESGAVAVSPAVETEPTTAQSEEPEPKPEPEPESPAPLADSPIAESEMAGLREYALSFVASFGYAFDSPEELDVDERIGFYSFLRIYNEDDPEQEELGSYLIAKERLTEYIALHFGMEEYEYGSSFLPQYDPELDAYHFYPATRRQLVRPEILEETREAGDLLFRTLVSKEDYTTGEIVSKSLMDYRFHVLEADGKLLLQAVSATVIPPEGTSRVPLSLPVIDKSGEPTSEALDFSLFLPDAWTTQGQEAGAELFDGEGRRVAEVEVRDLSFDELSSLYPDPVVFREFTAGPYQGHSYHTQSTVSESDTAIQNELFYCIRTDAGMIVFTFHPSFGTGIGTQNEAFLSYLDTIDSSYTEPLPADEAFVTIPVTLADSGSRLSAAHWVGDTLLLAAYATDSTNATASDVILYDTETQSERLLFSPRDYIGAVCLSDREILLTGRDKIYTLSLSSFDLLEETENPGLDWGAVTFGGLTANRGDGGIAIRHDDPSLPDIPVAEKTEASSFDVPIWSPDGQYLAYSKYALFQSASVQKLFADRDGKTFWELAVPERDYLGYWSSDSRYYVTTAEKELGGAVRLFDVEAGKQVAELVSPYVDSWYDVRDVHETSLFCLRQEKLGDRDVTICSFDALTGESKDYATVEYTTANGWCDARVSPYGDRLAVLDSEGGGVILVFEIE